MTDADYADIFARLKNTPAQAESQLHSLEHAAGGIGFYFNANKAEFMCSKQVGANSTLSGKLIKLVDQFTYLGSNILSTERDVSMHLTKALNVIDLVIEHIEI